MNQKFLILLGVFGIFILFYFDIFFIEEFSGRIKEIQYYKNKITFFLDKNEKPFIIFDNFVLNFSVGDSVLIEGEKNLYLGKEQIIVNKILVLN